jgi:preprotein translocase subunit Sss1
MSELQFAIGYGIVLLGSVGFILLATYLAHRMILKKGEVNE